MKNEINGFIYNWNEDLLFITEISREVRLYHFQEINKWFERLCNR